MSTGIRKSVPLSGFIRALKGFSNPQIAAIMEDLGLIPVLFITPRIIDTWRIEMADKLQNEKGDKELIRVAVAYMHDLLTSERGRELVAKYEQNFSFEIPLNRR